MTDTGNNAENNGATPPPPPPPPPPPAAGAPAAPAPATKPAWYENVAIVILALFCCSPLGLIFVWLNKSWTNKTKTIITAVIIGLAVAGGIIGALSGGSSSSDASAPGTTAAANSTQTTKAEGSNPTTAPASAKTCKETPNTESFDSKKQGLYPDRLGVTKTDHEAAVGDCVRINGATTYVTGFEVVASPSSLDNGQLIVVSMSETNRDTKPKSYTPGEWKVQTQKGVLEDHDYSWDVYDPNGNALKSAEMVTGATVEGTVAFEYSGPGTYYVRFDPYLTVSEDVGIWGITVP